MPQQPEEEAIKSPYDQWITTGLLVLGGLGTFVGIGSWLLKDATLLLAFVAGAGWMLSIPLLITAANNARRLNELQTEARDLRQQISEWRTIATQDSESLNRFVSRAIDLPMVKPRRSKPVVKDISGED